MTRHRTFRVVAVVAAGAVLAAAGVPATAYPRPGRTERVAVSTDGVPPGWWPSQRPAVTPDGRFVAFESQAPNLVPGVTNEEHDVYVRDRLVGTTERVSVSSDGEEGDGSSQWPVISADGRFVAFVSSAMTLVPGLEERRFQVYVHDRETRTTEIVSVSSDGEPGNNTSIIAGITPDGRHVTFSGFASNLVPDTTAMCSLGANVVSCPDVFVHDRQTATTERVSVSSDGEEGNGWSAGGAISADGRYVAFQSESTNLVPGDTNFEADAFVHDRQTGVTERVSVSSHGDEANAQSVNPTMSADGRFVAFESGASNLVPRDTNGVRVFVGTPLPPTDIFVHDRQTGVTERVSVSSAGVEADDWSVQPVLSADGRYVAFHSMATNLVPDDTNDTMDTFVHDRHTGATERVSVSGDGEEGNHWSVWGPAALTAGAREVVFATDAWNLVPGTEEGDREIVARDRGPEVGVGAVTAAAAGDGVAVSGWATFSGQVIAAASASGDAPPGAALAGGELIGARVVARPENEDLFLRLDVTAIPGVRPPTAPFALGGHLPGWAGLPAMLYGFEIDVGGTRYEARVLRSTENEVPAAPTFLLYRCDDECVEVEQLEGSYGNTGDSVLVSLPLSAVEVGGADVPLSVRAYTALGEAEPGAVVVLDEVVLPLAVVPAPKVLLGIAPAGTPEEDVVFDTAAPLADGLFAGTVSAAGLAAGDYDVWARACLGDVCGAASTPVMVG